MSNARSKKPPSNLHVRLHGGGVRPWSVPTRHLAKVLDAVQRLIDQREDVEDGAAVPGRNGAAIEEPAPEQLFLRFVYESDVADGAGALDATTAALRNQAYESADLDTVALIRRLAEQGELG